MAEIEITGEVFDSLATKVGSLNLSDAEQTVLNAVLARAANADPETEGFGFEIQESDTSVKNGQPMGFKNSDGILHLSGPGVRWGQALGFHIHVNP